MPDAIVHVALLVLLVVNVGCSTPSAPDPVIPLPIPPSTDVPPQARPVPQPAVAALAFEEESVIVSPDRYADGMFDYEPRFRLREVQGVSGATIQNVFVGDAPGSGDNTGPGCWRDPLRVPPGGSLDTFYTDAGWKWLGYCGPFSGGKSETPKLLVVVSFSDDHGVAGEVRTIMTRR